MKILNGQIYTTDFVFKQGNIKIQDTQIKELEYTTKSSANSFANDEIDATDCYIIPGLIDIHFHGCAGYDFCDGTKEALDAIAQYQGSQGVTSICPASMTLPKETLVEIMKNAAHYKKLQDSALHTEIDKPFASLVGINMEGPFLSAPKKGAQNENFLTLPSKSFYNDLQEASEGLIKLVAIAPELEGAMPFIQDISKECKISLAHTTANYELAKQALEIGASHVTHLFNAMMPFSHRESGLIGAAYDVPHTTVELICDGVHLTASTIRMAFSLFSDDRIILISDSMMAAGLNDGTYSLGGQAVTVNKNKATLADGTIAGSVTHLMDCMRTAISFGIPLESAIKCATANPAKVIGIDNKYGSIALDYKANLVILNKDLSLKYVIINGKLVS